MSVHADGLTAAKSREVTTAAAPKPKSEPRTLAQLAKTKRGVQKDFLPTYLMYAVVMIEATTRHAKSRLRAEADALADDLPVRSTWLVAPTSTVA